MLHNYKVLHGQVLETGNGVLAVAVDLDEDAN